MKRLFSTAGMALLLASQSYAAIVYDESINGDIANPIINLQTGSNEIVGTFSMRIDEANGIGFTRDSDFFRLGLAQGLTLDSYALSLDSINIIESGNIRTLTARLFDDGVQLSSPLIYTNFNPITLPADLVNSTNLNIGEGTSGLFGVRVNGYGSTSGQDALGHIEYNYTATAIVSGSAVPIPATAWLFLSALGGLVGLRAKR